MESNIVVKEQIKTLKIIYSALIIGVLVFATYVYFSFKNPMYKFDVNDMFSFVVPVLAISGIFISSFLYKSMLNKIDTNDSLQSKFAKYQTATLLKGAMLEGPALLASVASLLTNNAIYLIVVIVMLFIMYLKFPTFEKFKSEVTLSLEEKSHLNTL